MGIFDWLFDPSENKSTSTTSLPAWVTNAGKTNYQLASSIAQRPYQPYTMPRIAGFTGDQNKAMSTLRNWTPRALQNPEGGYRPPRLIDNIPGEGPGGIKDYMNPYTDEVIDRGVGRMREAADIGQQNINNQAHMSESFGDARHGLEAGNLEGEYRRDVGDFVAQQSSNAYNNAQGLREADINRLMGSQDLARADQGDLLTWIDSLYRSGGNQQDLSQKSATLAYQDFLKQQGYPTEMLDILTAALTGTPANKTTTSTTEGPSNAASILSGLGSVLGAFL